MKYYTLRDEDTGLYYRGHLGWSKKPRLFDMGGLKNSLHQNFRQFKEFEKGKVSDFHNRHFQYLGPLCLPAHYILREIEI